MGFEQRDPEFSDQVVVITGGSRGIGFATARRFLERGAQKQGTIINVSSGAGLSGHPEIATYCTSKFALVGFTESLALEVGTAGIRVYAVCPGRVATDMQVQYSGRRVGMPPERVADAILDLAGHHPPIAPGRCLTIRG
jgi:3-oxoacyl-[acyl-carrier protein] reductase